MTNKEISDYYLRRLRDKYSLTGAELQNIIESRRNSSIHKNSPYHDIEHIIRISNRTNRSITEIFEKEYIF
ncbi:MAG: hypothetical protein IJ574_00180 [Bacilli bacterium]|nr:hypothetical protein [Bacilli bacterium]